MSNGQAHQALQTAALLLSVKTPEDAKVLAAVLTAKWGRFVQDVLALIQTGVTNLPAIIKALQAQGVTLNAWEQEIVNVILVIAPLLATKQ